ncbi:MAG TPA: metal-dependent hydrolase [Verrucomicrobiae bacterium]|nr:metal-dependent hydrolase [Verrucomicrobiae bacterium]
MDIATHALASYVIARGFFPRRRWPVMVGMLFAGTVADVDLGSALFGPSAYFAWRRTYTHSLLGTVVVILLAVLFTRALARKNPEQHVTLFWPMFLAAGAHVLLDTLQSEGVMLLWPFRAIRFATNWLPTIDVWILVLLVGGILVPELFRLVTSEIGAKNKAPRGRNGAIVALILLAFYVAGRAALHSGSTALLEPHSYHGESARYVGSYPDSLSLFTWHGVVETQSLVCRVEVPVGPGQTFDPESADCLHKPEPSPELDAIQKTHLARKYISAVPFPRAVVEKNQTGYEIVIRSMRDVVEGETYHRLAARFLVNPDFGVSSEELVWTSDVHLR